MSQSAEVTNTCECQYCETCECSYSYVETDECPECLSTMEQSDCYGDCYTDAKEGALRLLLDWADTHKVEAWRIHAENLGWTRKSGTSAPIGGLEETFDALTLNGDWRIKFVLDGESLIAYRYSHDEPTGASFTFIPTREEVSV